MRFAPFKAEQPLLDVGLQEKGLKKDEKYFGRLFTKNLTIKVVC